MVKNIGVARNTILEKSNGSATIQKIIESDTPHFQAREEAPSNHAMDVAPSCPTRNLT